MAGTPFWSQRLSGNNGTRPFVGHPALRLAVFLALIVMPLCIDGIVPLLLLSAYVAGIVIHCRVPRVQVRRAAGTIAPFIMLVLLLNLLFARIGGGSGASWHGLSIGVVYGVRILVVYAAALVWIATTSQEEMARATAAVALPFSPSLARKLALFGFISFGFLPVFYEEYERIRMVQRFRGAEFSGGIMRRLGGARAVLIPLLVSAIRRSAQLSAAVELRSVQQSIGVLLVADRPAPADYARTLATAAIACALLFFPGM